MVQCDQMMQLGVVDGAQWSNFLWEWAAPQEGCARPCSAGVNQVITPHLFPPLFFSFILDLFTQSLKLRETIKRKPSLKWAEWNSDWTNHWSLLYFRRCCCILNASLPNIFGFCKILFFVLLSSWLNESRQVPQSVLSPLLKPKRTLRSVINTVPLHLLYLVGHGPRCGSQAPLFASSHFVPPPIRSRGIGIITGRWPAETFFPTSFKPRDYQAGRWSGVHDLIKVCLIERNHPSLGRRFKTSLPSIYMARN